MPAWATPQPVDAPDIDVALATVIADLSASLTELGQKVEPSDLSALATGAKQDTGNTSLASILAKITSDPATQTTLAAVLAKLSADPATQTTLAAALVQLQGIATSVDGLEGFTDGIESALSTLNAKDFATQTTLAALLAKVTSDASTATLQASANTKLDTLHTDIATTLLAKNEAMRALLAGTLLVDSSSGALVTAATYFSTADARNGQMATYTEQRGSDSKTRTITITRDTTSGSITAQSASAWA